MEKKPVVWIHSEPRVVSGHYRLVAELAQAHREAGMEVYILTDERNAELMQAPDSAFDFSGLHFLPLPNTTEPFDSDPAQHQTRAAKAIEYYDNEALCPDVIITEQWPLGGNLQKQFLEILFDHAQTHDSPIIVSAVRDVTGRKPGHSQWWRRLSDYCDAVYVCGGTQQLSDFPEYARKQTRIGPTADPDSPTEPYQGWTAFFDPANVYYVGGLTKPDAIPPAQPDVPQEVIAMVGHTYGDHSKEDKMTILQTVMQAWAQSELSNQHPLHMLLPADMHTLPFAADLKALELLKGRLPKGEHIILDGMKPKEEYYQLLANCKLLVTAGGSSALEAAMVGAPMLLTPLSRRTNEQYKHADKLVDTGIVSAIPNSGQKIEGMFSGAVRSELFKDKDSDDYVPVLKAGFFQQSVLEQERVAICAYFMDEAAKVSRQHVKEKAQEHIPPGGPTRAAQITQELLRNKAHVLEERHHKQEVRCPDRW